MLQQAQSIFAYLNTIYAFGQQDKIKSYPVYDMHSIKLTKVKRKEEEKSRKNKINKFST